MPSADDRIADMNTTAGFLIPIWSTDPMPGREQTHELTVSDHRKTQEGYACPRCLCDYGGIYRVRCPFCDHVRNVELDFVAPPQMWVDHRNELNGPAVTTQGPDIEAAIRRVMGNPNVEHATISQLRPSRWGRGRPV